MGTLDKILHVLGAGAAGLAITAATGGVALPAWVTAVCIGVAFGTGTVTQPISGLFGSKPDAPKTP